MQTQNEVNYIPGFVYVTVPSGSIKYCLAMTDEGEVILVGRLVVEANPIVQYEMNALTKKGWRMFKGSTIFGQEVYICMPDIDDFERTSADILREINSLHKPLGA